MEPSTSQNNYKPIVPQPQSPQPQVLNTQNQQQTVSTDSSLQPNLNINRSSAFSLDAPVDGKRVSAALIDLLLIFIILSLTDQGGFLEFKFTSSGYSMNAGPIISLSGLKGLMTVIVIALYFIILEATKGATIGKLAAGIKVVKADGTKLGIGGVIVRNISRIIDGFPYAIPYLLGMIVMATNKKRQRLGDKFAHSIVIKNR